MGIISFLFGFNGRINRTSFFLATTAQGLLILVGALLLASMGELPDIKSVTKASAQQLSSFDVVEQASGVFVVWSILQLPLIFKRVRDMHETLTFAWLYSFFVFVGTAPGFYLVGHGFASVLITWFSMQGSRAASEGDPEAKSSDELNWEEDAARDQIDLVARARELKEAETRLQAKHLQKEAPIVEAKLSFGKRAGMTAVNE